MRMIQVMRFFPEKNNLSLVSYLILQNEPMRFSRISKWNISLLLPLHFFLYRWMLKSDLIIGGKCLSWYKAFFIPLLRESQREGWNYSAVHRLSDFSGVFRHGSYSMDHFWISPWQFLKIVTALIPIYNWLLQSGNDTHGLQKCLWKAYLTGFWQISAFI